MKFIENGATMDCQLIINFDEIAIYALATFLFGGIYIGYNLKRGDDE